MRFPSRGSLLAAALCLTFANPAAATVRSFAVMANGEKVGTLTVDVNERSAAVDYTVSNNGRGPKLRESIEVDAAGIPIRWTVDGSSLFGNSVQERYAWSGGFAEWSSQADKGRVEAQTPPLYIGNDVSPWALYVYVKALLKAPGQSLAVLPQGQLRLEEAARISIGEGRDAVPLTVYALSGVDLQPRFVVCDAKGELFGTLDGLIRQGFEGHADELERRADSIGLERAMQAQSKLAHRFDKPVRIVNVRIFDPQTMRLGDPSSVVVFRDKITLIEPARAAAGRSNSMGEVVIDGQGGTLVAGLHDMHSHTTLLSNLFNLAAGVTATRDMGNDNNLLPGWIERLESVTLAGPRIVPTGFIEGRSPHSARLGFVVDTLAEGLEKVRWYAARGYWQIKIYNSMNPDWVAPLAAEAHRLGMGVTGHVPAFSSPDRVLKDGYDDIAHINQLMLGWVIEPSEDTRTPLRLTAMARAKDLDFRSARVRTTIDLMKAKGAALDTTAMTLERLMLSRQGEVPEGDAPYLDHAPIAYQRYRKRTFVPLKAPQDDAAYRGGFAKLIETLRTLDADGVQLLPGTDDTTGFSLHRELELYVKAGMSPGKALRRATLDCERYFGRDHLLGSIERGKLADFILVDGDPTRDISKIRQVRMTMRGGVVYFPSEIYSYLSVRPFAAPPPIISADSNQSAAQSGGPFVTKHSGVFGGQRVNYVAVVEQTLVKDERGEPTVRFVSTSYVREGVDSTTRPVIFAFNGGPSVSSATLHMLALGPKHILITQDPAQPPPDPPQLVDNPETVLDVADLVFVDPPETGFTRVLPSGKREYFYSANGDAQTVSDFVRAWIAEHGRQRSPKYLVGESYGTIRATLMAGVLAESMPLDGVFLFGQAINIAETSQRAQNMVAYATNLPALAAVAAYHGKTDRRPASMAALIDEAYAWGMSDYLHALIQGRDLPDRKRRAVAKRLQNLTGISADYYLEHDLIISKVEFAKQLLKDQRSITAAYDARYVGPAPQTGGEAADPMSKALAAIMPMLAVHMSKSLGVTWPMTDYRGAAPDAGRLWQWNPTGGIGGPFWDYDYPAQLTKAFAANPQFRLMIGTGIYDLTTTVGPARYLAAKSNWPRERVFLREYEGGHVAYTHEPSRRAFCADIRAFVTGRSP